MKTTAANGMCRVDNKTGWIIDDHFDPDSQTPRIDDEGAYAKELEMLEKIEVYIGKRDWLEELLEDTQKDLEEER